MVTNRWDVNSRIPGGLQDGSARWYGNGFPIDNDVYGFSHIDPLDSAVRH